MYSSLYGASSALICLFFLFFPPHTGPRCGSLADGRHAPPSAVPKQQDETRACGKGKKKGLLESRSTCRPTAGVTTVLALLHPPSIPHAEPSQTVEAIPAPSAPAHGPDRRRAPNALPFLILRLHACRRPATDTPLIARNGRAQRAMASVDAASIRALPTATASRERR
ncbi:hypothetical protein CDD83_9877 [Cordyceps sp. RAO-2017]|nr:hypothetical protein CDD83_9877 [Cordyceps sp. RAO-2017]